MIKDKFKDRFEEFATEDNGLGGYGGMFSTICKSDWLNALSEIDKEVEKEKEELIDMIIELKNDLSSELHDRYDMSLTSPVTVRRFNRDMEPVKQAERLISKYIGIIPK